MIIDASVLLQAFFPDETHQSKVHALLQAYILGDLNLAAPTLLAYEVTNAVLQAVRRGRITSETGQEILTTFQNLGIELRPVPLTRTLSLAHELGRSAYDAAYLALAEEANEPLLTGDLRLFNSVHERLPWVLWIGDDLP